MARCRNKQHKKKHVANNKQRRRRPKKVDHVKELCDDVFGKIFDKLEDRELLGLRRVCGLWKCLVEARFGGRTRYLRLNGKPIEPTTDCTKWSPTPSMRALQFEGTWDEPVGLLSCQKLSLTIPEAHFNQQMAQSLGDIFPNIKNLIIYFDLAGPRDNIETLCHIWSDKPFAMVDSFWLIMSNDITQPENLNLLCSSVGTGFNALKRLDLLVSDYEHRIEFNSWTQLASYVPLLTHFGIS